MFQVLLFLSVYVLGFVFTLVVNPTFSFVLYEAVYFFNPLERWWSYSIPTLRYSLFTVLLMFLALFIKRLRGPSQNSLLAAPQFKWVYLIVALYSITWFYAVLPDDHQTAAINFIKLAIIISVAYKLIDTPRNLDYALWGYIFGSWYISFLAYQTGRNSFGNRVEGIGTVDSPDSNGIAAAIAPSIVVCLYYFWMSKNIFHKFLFAMAGVFVANGIILINSRGSFLGAGVSLAFFMYYLYFSPIQQKYQKGIAIGITLIGLSGLIYIIDDTFLARISTMNQVEISEEEETGTTRFIFWMKSMEMAQDYPFGNGVRGFDFYAPDYLPEGLDTGGSRNRSVHSTWFEALTEIGYLGLFLLILMVYSTVMSLRKCMHTLKEKEDLRNYFKVVMLLAATFSYIISMTFMNRLRAELLYWFVLYSACAYNIYVIKALSDKTEEPLNSTENDAHESVKNKHHV